MNHIFYLIHQFYVFMEISELVFIFFQKCDEITDRKLQIEL